MKQLYVYLSSTSNSGRNHACDSGAIERTRNEGTWRMTWDFMWRVYNILDQQMSINISSLMLKIWNVSPLVIWKVWRVTNCGRWNFENFGGNLNRFCRLCVLAQILNSTMTCKSRNWRQISHVDEMKQLFYTNKKVQLDSVF